MDQIDWSQLVWDLMQERISVARIAKVVKVSRSTVTNWRDWAGEPLHSNGERLIRLWIKIKKCERHAVPKRNKSVNRVDF